MHWVYILLLWNKALFRYVDCHSGKVQKKHVRLQINYIQSRSRELVFTFQHHQLICIVASRICTILVKLKRQHLSSNNIPTTSYLVKFSGSSQQWGFDVYELWFEQENLLRYLIQHWVHGICWQSFYKQICKRLFDATRSRRAGTYITQQFSDVI